MSFHADADFEGTNLVWSAPWRARFIDILRHVASVEAHFSQPSSTTHSSLRLENTSSRCSTSHSHPFNKLSLPRYMSRCGGNWEQCAGREPHKDEISCISLSSRKHPAARLHLYCISATGPTWGCLQMGGTSKTGGFSSAVCHKKSRPKGTLPPKKRHTHVRSCVEPPIRLTSILSQCSVALQLRIR